MHCGKHGGNSAAISSGRSAVPGSHGLRCLWEKRWVSPFCFRQVGGIDVSTRMNASLSFLSAFWMLGGLWPTGGSAEKERRRLESEIARLPARPTPEAALAVGFHSRAVASPDTPLSVTLDLGEAYPLENIFVVPAAPAGIWGYGFPHRFRVDVFETEAEAAPVCLLDYTGEDQPLPDGPLAVAGGGQLARKIRFTATHLRRHPNAERRFMLCLSEVYAFSGGRNVALGCAVSSVGERPNLPAWSPRNLVDGASALGLPVSPDPVPSQKINSGWHSGITSRQDTVKWVQVDLGERYEIDEIRAMSLSPVTFTNRPGFGFPERFYIEVSDTPDFERGERVVDSTQRDYPNPGNHVAAWRVPKRKGRYVRWTATKLWNRWDDFIFALSEWEVYSGSRNVAYGKQVTSPDPSPNEMFSTEYLVDGRAGAGRLEDLQGWLAALALRERLERRWAVLVAEEEAAVERLRRMGVWGSGALAVGVLCVAIFWGWRARRERQREMRALREQIARDLHDEIGSSLWTIALMSELGSRTGDVRALGEVQRLASDAADSMRSLVWMIRDGEAPGLEQLESALRAQAERILSGMNFAITSTGQRPSLGKEAEFHRNLFLFWKEALHNVIRHARATHVALDLEWSPGRLRLSIADNGCGFHPQTHFAGAGLANMRHRAKALGAELQILSAPGEGTRIGLEVSLL